MAAAVARVPIHSTAGAVPIKNEKGELTMQKVKVSRYVAGKRPEYAKYSSDEDDEEPELMGEQVFGRDREIDDEEIEKVYEKAEKTDRRLRRLQEHVKDEEEDEDMEMPRRRLREPEVIATGEDDASGDEEESEMRMRVQDMEESSDDEEMDEDTLQRRRKLMKERAQQKQADKDLLDLEEETKSDAEQEEESSEYEEYTDSEEETGPRLKPVFVRKSDRVTVQEREKMELDEEQQEETRKKRVEERKKVSRNLAGELLRQELQEKQGVAKVEDVVVTDDENDEEEYESWKVRELKRIKRDRDEREQIEKDRHEAERIHNMTEDERRAEFRNNPKQVVNKAIKGKYKFLQKYFHRGAFFLDEDENTYKRDFAKPTLEDHFDKTILPKVMQVKNFGRSGRTKYTHLVEQDTTAFESSWSQDNTLAMKFHTVHAGGSKQMFERPSKRRK